MTFWIKPLKDAGGMEYWVLFTPGNFHNPTAIISDTEMTAIANRVAGVQQQAEDLGMAILAYRKLNRMTQEQFAARSGVSRNYICQIENGKADNLSLSMYQRITKALKP